MRYLISTICIALLLWGCDNTTAVSAKPKVVRKKIVAPKEKVAKVRTQKTVRKAETKPDAKQQTETVVAKVDKTQADAKSRPAAKKDTDSQPLIAQKAETKPVQNQQPSQVKQKKPAISPKSEITEIKQAVNKQKQTKPGVGNKTVAGKQVKAAKPVTAAKMLPGGTPPLYDPTGKIDPFEPLIREKPVVAKKSKQIKRTPRTPLERIDLSQLRLVGIILAASGNRALVEESTGKGYVIKKGTYIGTNGGKIIQIQKEIVTVEEKFEDVFGKIQTRKRELKLPKPPGEF
jgi:type IV pilus assembly protein PilP